MQLIAVKILPIFIALFILYMSLRRQLTMFVPYPNAGIIEQVRRQYNPVQSALIVAHVTLCREDELLDINQVRNNLGHISHTPVTIHFGSPERFGKNGEGSLLPALEPYTSFQQLRATALESVIGYPRLHQPHITLMHPRNSVCTDELFARILGFDFPQKISFDSLSLIEQKGQQPWHVLETYKLR
jgi:hypothetical protein